MSLTQSRSMGAGSTRGSGTVALSVRGTTYGYAGSFAFSSISGLAAGDKLVAFILSNDSANNSNDAPIFISGGANWTLSTAVETYPVAVQARVSMYTRTATASSTDNFSISDADGTPLFGVIAITGGTGQRAAPTVTGPVLASSITLPSTGNTGDLLLAAIGCGNSPVAAIPTGMTDFTGLQNGFSTLRVAYQLNQTAGSKVVTMTANVGGALTVAYKP